MSEHNDETEKHALIIVALVVLLAVSGAIGLGIASTRPRGAPPPPPPAIEVVSAFEQVRFVAGQDSLPPDGQAALGRISDSARGNPGSVIVIAGTFDARSDAAARLDLAQRRLQQVRHALEANGVAPQQLITAKPMPLRPGDDASQADRVEMRLQ